MGTFAQDTFVRPNQAGFGTGSDGNTYTQARGTQTLSIVSDQGSIAYNGSTVLGVELYSALSKADAEISVNLVDTGSTGILGVTLRYVDSNNFYYCDLGNVAGNLEIGKCVGGTFTTLQTFAFSSSSNTSYTIKFNGTGTTLKAKVWLTSSGEPASFQATITDTSLSSGQFGVIAAPGVSSSCLFDHLLITDGTTTVVQSFSETTTVIESFALEDVLNASEQAAQSELCSLAAVLASTEVQAVIEQYSLAGTIGNTEIQVATEQYSLAGADTSTELQAVIEQYDLTSVANSTEALSLAETALLAGEITSNEQSIVGGTWIAVSQVLSSEQIALIEQFTLFANLSQAEVTQVIESFFSGNPVPALYMQATWQSRSGKATFVGRSGQTTWTGRSGKMIWRAR